MRAVDAFKADTAVGLVGGALASYALELRRTRGGIPVVIGMARAGQMRRPTTPALRPPMGCGAVQHSSVLR